MAEAGAGDRGQLAGLRSRSDLNGRRVEVRGPAPGKDGAPRFRVEVLFGAGAGTVLKVKAANLDLDRDRALDDPAMATLVAAMQALAPGAPPPEERRDWAGLPEVLLGKVAEKVISQNEARWVTYLKERGWSDNDIQEEMAKRKSDGSCLFVMAMVCKPWRKAQLKVGGPLRTRVESDVILPGRVALVKWALAEGCPRDNGRRFTLAGAAAEHGHLELVRWLCEEEGFARNKRMMIQAASSGNLDIMQWLRASGCPWSTMTCELAALYGQLEVLRWARENGCDWDWRTCAHAAAGGHLETLQWLRAEGCPWNYGTCQFAVDRGHVEVLRWARENGAPWTAATRDRAASELGYTDDLGNLVDGDLVVE